MKATLCESLFGNIFTFVIKCIKMRLKDNIAIVTGGARGIGKAIAELFAGEGATVYIWDLLDIGSETAKELSSKGYQVEFNKVSVTDRTQIEAASQAIFDKHGKIDILINNAGILRDKSLFKMTDDEWDASIDVNLKGTFLCTRAVAAYMRQNKYGRIVSAASTTGLRGNFGQANYAAAKGGIMSMSKTFAIELGKHGITSNVIAPGYTQTHMTDTIPKEIQQMALMQIPVGFIADPIDIAQGYLFLASPEARFVSGITLPIDGGFTR